MLLKRLLFVCYGIIGSSILSFGQNADFCTELNKIVADGNNKFKLTRGEQQSVNETGITWASNVAVPGMISARFVSAMGLFYEGAVFQTKSVDEIGAVYDKYKTQLSSCFLNNGYKLSTADNFSPGLSMFRKLVFMKTDDSGDVPPPHVTMEVTYYKAAQLYTIVVYVFEH